MKLPSESLIASTKITHYLLVPQAKGDKSRFFALAGYDTTMADQLRHDIRTQILPCDAVATERNKHGQYYQITCQLTGPNGRVLWVRSIWMKEHLSQQTKFITLVPESRLQNER
jgi:hypothetical protein